MRRFLILFFCISYISYAQNIKNEEAVQEHTTTSVLLQVLGTVQDAGAPHIACEKDCCTALLARDQKLLHVVSLGIIDGLAQKTFLFEATPDMTGQLRDLRLKAGFKYTDIPDGIFVTHAHIGHYSGLMYLGKEATNAEKVPLYAMPKMRDFLKKNGPWSQLIYGGNIALKELENQKGVQLTKHLKVVPFTVPHRDEYSETVGYRIMGPEKNVLFIPDIDKWEKWKTSIISEIKKVDYAFLDATFYDSEEINNRDISEIPHPFVIESIALFKGLSSSEKEKIHFIHFNHTNPLLDSNSPKSKAVLQNGFKIARKGMIFKL